jgi:hypothetical protein
MYYIYFNKQNELVLIWLKKVCVKTVLVVNLILATKKTHTLINIFDFIQKLDLLIYGLYALTKKMVGIKNSQRGLFENRKRSHLDIITIWYDICNDLLFSC